MEDQGDDGYDPAKGMAIGLLLAVFLFWLPLIVIVRYWSDISIQQFAVDLWNDIS